MAYDFEALVGHLYIVGGRVISIPPPGALVEVAPKKAARGRETETVFVMVMPSGQFTGPTTFYEQIARRVTEDYFRHSGSVTSALRTIFNNLNHNLVEHNRQGGRTYEANMLCAVLRGDDLIVARVGSGVAILREMGKTSTFPEDLQDDESLFKPPLGVHPIPDVRLTQYKVANGSRLILGDATLADFDLDQVTNALMRTDMSEVLAGLRLLAIEQAAIMAVEFVPPDAPVGLPVREAESSVAVTHPEKPKTSPEKPRRSQSPRAKETNRLADVREGMQSQAKRGVGSAALGMSRIFDLFNRMLGLLPGSDTGGRTLLSNRLAASITLIVPIIVVVVVVFMWLGQPELSDFELCLKEATGRAELARSISPTNVVDTLNAWNLVLAQVNTCEKLRPGDAIIASIRSEGQEIVDRLSMIDRRNAAVIAALPQAALGRIVLQGADVYVVDNANSQVYRIVLSGDGRSAASVQQPIPAMRKGAVVDQYTVDDLVDITFDLQENRIMAVDREGVVIRCAPQLITSCEPQRLLATENWITPVAISSWQGRLYVLDPGANQLWRYDPTSGNYASAPREYFTGQGRPSLINSVDLGIDDNGRVYILRSDGVLSVYFQGEIQDFGWAGFPEAAAISGADSLFVSNSPILPGLFVASRRDRTVFETTLAGSHQRSYRMYDQDQFALLSGVTVDASQQLVYATSGNSILMFPKE